MLRASFLVLGACVLTASAWGVFHQPAGRARGALRQEGSTKPVATVPSYALRHLMPGPPMPVNPFSLIVSPVNARLTDGVPPN